MPKWPRVFSFTGNPMQDHSGAMIQWQSVKSRKSQSTRSSWFYRCVKINCDRIKRSCQQLSDFWSSDAAKRKKMVLTWKNRAYCRDDWRWRQRCFGAEEADCSIAMASGVDAARQVSNLVLLENQFDALPSVMDEGRRVINNITRSGSLC